MKYLETVPVVRRLHLGECPECGNKLTFIHISTNIGELNKNGMADSVRDPIEKIGVFCKRCSYSQKAIQIGLKIIPEDRIYKYDINWDKKYLEDNTLVNCIPGENPFNKDKE